MNDELRPQYLKDFVGNEEIKKCLDINIQSAKIRNDKCVHTLFISKSGLGKTSLVRIVANELNVKMHIINCATLQKVKEVYPIILKAKDKEIVFLDEVHRLSPTISDLLLSVLESNSFIIPNDEKLRKIQLKNFSIFAATTSPNKLDEPFRNRFTCTYNLKDYSHDDMIKIAQINADKLGLSLNFDCYDYIAQTSKMVPRVLNSRLLWLRDYKTANKIASFNRSTLVAALDLFGVDSDGLDKKDREYLELLQSEGRPMALKTIADRLHLSKDYVEYIEENLIRLNKIEKTNKGRILKIDRKDDSDFSDLLKNLLK